MTGHDIITVGASAGGVEALTALVGALPARLPVSIFVVLHTWPKAASHLPAILSAAGPLPALHPDDNAPIKRATIYVAPPDYHMTVRTGAIRILKGRREHCTRPAIDPLFRSAARWYGPRVVGIILSGTLDDGSRGMIAIKRRGGIAIVQDLEQAAFRGMPRSAMLAVDADFCLPVQEIAHKIAELAVEEPLEAKTVTAAEGLATTVPSALTCRECNGTLCASQDGRLLRFTCRLGHVYSARRLLSQQSDSGERAAWSVVRALEENAALGHRLAGHARAHGKSELAAKYEVAARASEKHARQLLRLMQRDDGDESWHAPS